MHHKVVYRGAKALKDIGCAVLRFNFRGTGTSAGTFADGRGEMDDFRAGLDFVADRYSGLETWAAGFSFGASLESLVTNPDSQGPSPSRGTL